MIRGADFYSHVLIQASQHPNITFAYGTITHCANQNNLAYAVVNGVQYFAQYIFSSLLPYGGINSTGRATTLLQHFKGWVIETPTNVFNQAEATFMDFRVGQQAGTTFVYVLPVAPNKALVEYTLVSPTLLPDNEYNEGLKAYISQYITTQPYTVTEEEFGVIPMTDHHFPRSDGRIIFTGTAGGQTKASSGFTFQFIQKQTAGIIKALIKGRPPLPGTALLSKRFHLYDGILLHIISTGKMPGDAIFTRLFKKMPPATILRFLDNETSLLQELGIMSSMPTGIFLPVAIRKIFGL
jgi:lycopene beta-cyclase